MMSTVTTGVFLCFKQKTAYEMRISDWSSDVCSSDLGLHQFRHRGVPGAFDPYRACKYAWDLNVLPFIRPGLQGRSEEHTSELQSLMRISYAVFCLKKKKNTILKT